MSKTVKPFLKWVGGKTQIIDRLISEFPTEINNYHEIFLGGGSVLFMLLSHVKNGLIKLHGNVYAYDINEPLIYTYKNIQTRPDEVYNEVQNLLTDFHSCGTSDIINRAPNTLIEAKMTRENYYYWTRAEYNNLRDKTSPKGSAMFIFLNKTCFRGVFRLGPNGFNVPYGHYKKVPEIINKQHINEIHQLIQGVVFKCEDFYTSLSIPIHSNDYVYLDPPYAPETETSFVGYTENGFDVTSHMNLFKLIHKLSHTKMMLSNADVRLVRDNFKSEKYNITSLVCKRSINSKTPEQKTTEVIIKNY